MRWYLDIILPDRTGGLEVVGAPQIWEVDTAWKFATDNFTDNFHVFSTHHSLVELGMLPNDPDFASHGHMITSGNGHILHMVQGPPDDEEFKAFGLPRRAARADEAQPLAGQVQDAPSRSVSAPGPCGRTSTACSCQSSDVIDGKQWPFMNFRMEEPLTPTRTRMWSWFTVDKSADRRLQEGSYETYVRTFGPAGIFDQDDMENWEDCTRVERRPGGASATTCTTSMGVNRPIRSPTGRARARPTTTATAR